MNQVAIRTSMTQARELIGGLRAASTEFQKGVDQATASGASIDPALVNECVHALSAIAQSMDVTAELLRALAVGMTAVVDEEH